MQANEAPEPSGLLGVEGLQAAVRVGQGSYGVVYKAFQPAYGRTVAVKVLTTPLLDEDSRHRFERECRALGSLSSHPFIVTLHSAGITDDGHPYLIMDYLPGGSLASRLAAGPLDWRDVADIGVKLSGALATAHGQGVLHRDIKPDNVLVSAYGEPQLADFGVAKIQGGTATSSATITGSLAHAAPEVISGVSATAAADIWSLASTLATLLLGHPPFHRAGDETLHPLITRILTQPPPDMRPLGVPSAICDVIEAGLAKDSWERQQTAVDFGHALQEAQRSLGITPTAVAAAATSAVTPTPPVVAAPAVTPTSAVKPTLAVKPTPAVTPTPAAAPSPEPDPETATRKRGDTGLPSGVAAMGAGVAPAGTAPPAGTVPPVTLAPSQPPSSERISAAGTVVPGASGGANDPPSLYPEREPLFARLRRYPNNHRRPLAGISAAAVVAIALLVVLSHVGTKHPNPTRTVRFSQATSVPVGTAPGTTAQAKVSTPPISGSTTPLGAPMPGVTGNPGKSRPNTIQSPPDIGQPWIITNPTSTSTSTSTSTTSTTTTTPTGIPR